MKKILLVDDEQAILKALRRELFSWGQENQIEILTTNNPLSVNSLIEDNKEIFLLISDLKMPEKLGSELLQEVKNEFPNIITILLTGYSTPQELMKAIKAGIFSFILKPWDTEYLISEVSKAYELFNHKKEKEKLEKQLAEELKWAGEMQKRLLTREIPVTDRIAFEISYKPLPELHCGGDYYDIIKLDNDRFIVLLGDVAGHGVKAALITTILKSTIFKFDSISVIGMIFLSEDLPNTHFPSLFITALKMK